MTNEIKTKQQNTTESQQDGHITENPTHTGNYTERDLRYARYRQERDLKRINGLIEKANSELRTEQPYDIYEDENYREPLSVDLIKVVDIQLSTGGDADGYKLFFRDNELQKGVYYWADWGVYEEVGLTDEEAELIADHYNVDISTFTE